MTDATTEIRSPVTSGELAKAVTRGALGVNDYERTEELGFTNARASIVREALRRVNVGEGRQALEELAGKGDAEKGF